MSVVPPGAKGTMSDTLPVLGKPAGRSAACAACPQSAQEAASAINWRRAIGKEGVVTMGFSNETLCKDFPGIQNGVWIDGRLYLAHERYGNG